MELNRSIPDVEYKQILKISCMEGEYIWRVQGF